MAIPLPCIRCPESVNDAPIIHRLSALDNLTAMNGGRDGATPPPDPHSL